MPAQTPVAVALPQSEANSPDRDLLQRLMGTIPKLTKIDCVYRLSGGYSSARVYIGLPEIQGVQGSQPWIIKVGAEEELRKENHGLTYARTQVPPEHVASKIEYLTDGSEAVLVMEYGNYRGRPPVDLETVLRRVESHEAVSTLVRVVQGWISKPVWKTTNLTQTVKDWCASRLRDLPEAIYAQREIPSVYSPDFGEAYANPAYHLVRDIRKRELRAPFAFTHGDLNLRNVLFARDSDGTVDMSPVLIDFRYAGVDQFSIVDLAKLESCLRYQCLQSIEDLSTLSQTVAFLGATRTDLRLSSLPDVCADKWIQDLWRCMRSIRELAIKALSADDNPDLSLVYWGTLLSYGISAATYSQLPSEVRVLAYLDAAAIFTKCFQDRLPGEQFVLPVHTTYSPPVVTLAPPSVPVSEESILLQAAVGRRAVLVVGSGYGRSSGVEPVLAFTQRLYKQLCSEDPPVASASILLEALQRKRPRQDVLRAIRNRTYQWQDSSDRVFTILPWAAVLSNHFHALPYSSITSHDGAEPIRIESVDDATRNADRITGGAACYLPLRGDTNSHPDQLVLTAVDKRNREQAISLVARALEQRQASLAVVFWKCEELSVDEIMEVRNALCAEMAVSVDVYYLSDFDDSSRDAALRSVDILRINLSMSRLVDRAAASAAPSKPIELSGLEWSDGSKAFALPNFERMSHGLVRLYGSERKRLGAERSREDFLLGAPATQMDIKEGRVVRRHVLDEEVLPAIRGALAERNREPRAVVLRGRAGAGVSTLMVNAQQEMDRDHAGPILVADTQIAAGRREWREVGDLIAEVSRVTSKTVMLFAEANDQTLENVIDAVDVCIENGGRVVAVLGGRRDALLHELPAEARRLFYQDISISDTLVQSEWQSLARIVKGHGFSREVSTDELGSRMQKVGRLLPALFEATDRKNRKFRDIVAYEYELYSRDAIVQLAYRLICSAGAFGVPLSQYWLLKALGHRGVLEAKRILTALSDDIIVQAESPGEVGDTTIHPIHRIIAEEVAKIATPEANDRLRDIVRLISSANMASRLQGMSVASLLYRGGPLVRWIEAAYAGFSEREEHIRDVFEAALENKPLHPQAELHIRQHYALLLRKWRRFEEALGHLQVAQGLDPENSATLHILGLVHESRAIESWRTYVRQRDDATLARARGDEQDATEFFRNVREKRPYEEHGYESEARYFRKKGEVLPIGAVDQSLSDEAKAQVFQALYLLQTAEARVPKTELKETPQTKGLLLRLAGDLDGAIKTLLDERSTTPDPVRKVRLTRSAIALSVEAKRWDAARYLCEEMIASQERDAAMYLIHDECLRQLGASVKERARDFRESSEEYNRWDIETQVRWAEISLFEGYVDRCIEALRKADELARQNLRVVERERIRGTLLASGVPKRFIGRINRLMKPDEGLVGIADTNRDIFFRAKPELRGSLKIGDLLSYHIAWRIRGLRAIDVEVEKPATP